MKSLSFLLTTVLEGDGKIAAVSMLEVQSAMVKYVTNLKLGDLQVVLADTHVQFRSGLRGAMVDARMFKITDASRVDKLRESLSQSLGSDLLVWDVGLGGGDVWKMITAIRNIKLGHNPLM